jgi:hypothetical protein
VKTEIAPAGRFAVHLFGHMHETDIKYLRSGGSLKATRLSQGCSVFGMEKFGEPPTVHAELEDDQGTAPEAITIRSRATKRPPVRPSPAPERVAFAPHSTLPARRPFFGRKKDLELIAKYLLPEDRSWGVVVDGPGGMGKTALALEAAHRAPAEHFPLKLWITAKNRELVS